MSDHGGYSPMIRGNDRMHGDLRVDVATLYERVDSIFRMVQEREKQLGTALEATQRASDKSESAQKEINTVSNEWRGSLRDAQEANKQQAALHPTQSDLDAVRAIANKAAPIDKVDALAERVVNLEKLGVGNSNAKAAGIASQDLIIRIIMLMIAAGGVLFGLLK